MRDQDKDTLEKISQEIRDIAKTFSDLSETVVINNQPAAIALGGAVSHLREAADHINAALNFSQN